MSGKKDDVSMIACFHYQENIMQQGLEHYKCRNESGKLLKKWNCRGQFMLVTVFLSGAYHKQITQIFNGIPLSSEKFTLHFVSF